MPLAASLTIDIGCADRLLLDGRLSRSRREEVSKSMYKTELTKKVAVETRLSQRAVSDVINATLEKIHWALRHGDTAAFPGFGTFYTRHQKEGKVRDIRSGKIVTVPAHRVAAFRVGAVLKRSVRKGRKAKA
jgi:DNA-binding protein HU-beta